MKEPDKNPPEENRDIVYYYSREQRLSRASPSVRELYENTRNRTGLVKAIAGNRANLLLLFSIIIICFMYVLASRGSGNPNAQISLGNTELSFLIYEEDPVLFFYAEKTIPQGLAAYTGAVDIAVSPVVQEGEEAPIETRHVFFSLASPESYLFSLPFEGEEFLVVIKTDNETAARTITKSSESPGD